jgi:poly-gamma-glutamate synthesis protein (capsule biosynthesis protein)
LPTKQSPYYFLTLLLLVFFIVSACTPPANSTLPTTQSTPIVQSSVEFRTFTPTPSPTTAPLKIAAKAQRTGVPQVYALVAPFPTVTDGVTTAELNLAWTQGTSPAAFSGHPLLMDQSTLDVLKSLWGEPASGLVEVVASDRLLEEAWADPGSWAIVPFEALQPKWKVLTIDGQSPVRKQFELSTYPLVASLDPAAQAVSNYDPSKMTTVIMTGVTALVRATAYTMELKSVTYPGEKIRDIMREADIAHISNEIPFYTGCTFPKPDQGALVFCSDPKYIDLLTDVGTDVVELTGNHFSDRGSAGMRETIAIYNEKGLPYFGGGLDLQDSLKPALFEVNGNKIAFIGCNKPDVNRFPTATEFKPGAAPCDFDYLAGEINKLKAEGYVVISTFQWNESYDAYPSPQQIKDFQLMVDSGASVVSGSQAHYAQKMEFYKDAFIHYGLGNMFFDQMGDQDWMPKGIRRVFLDRYVIYDGRLISVEPIPAMMEDYSRPRPMTDAEKPGFLKEYFYYSGWIPNVPTPTATITPTLTPMSVPPVSTATP